MAKSGHDAYVSTVSRSPGSVVAKDRTLLAAGVTHGTESPAAGAPGLWRRAVAWVSALAVLVLVATAWFVGARIQSPSQAAARATPPEPSVLTAPVELRVLSTTVIARGDVAAVTSVVVGLPSSVTLDPVVTGVFVRPGDEVGEGERVVEVSGRPVFVFAGAVPAYREMKPGASGIDVLQLQISLVRLGCAAETDGVFGPATKLCVAAMYFDLGYEPSPSSSTEAADLAAARAAASDTQAAVDAAEVSLASAGEGAVESMVLDAQATVDAARRLLDDAYAARLTGVARAQNDLALAEGDRDRLASDPSTIQADLDAASIAVANAELTLLDVQRSADTAVADAVASLAVAKAKYQEVIEKPDTTAQMEELARAVATRDAAVGALEELERKSGPTVPLGEVVFLPELPAVVQASVDGVGPLDLGTTQSTAGLMTLTVGRLQVNSRASIGDAKLLTVGMDVQLLDETSDTTYPAALLSVDATATAGPDGTQGVALVLEPIDPLPAALAGANLRVTFATATTEAAVLVVPLAAISAGADGRARVDRIAADGTSIEVTVTPGLSADGFVEIRPYEPGALAPGDEVIIG